MSYIPDKKQYPGIQYAELKDAQFKLVCTTGGSNKFYRIKVAGQHVTIVYGAIGNTGLVPSVKTHNTFAQATKEAQKIVKEKLNKGYVWEVPAIVDNMELYEVAEFKKSTTPESMEKFNSFNNLLTQYYNDGSKPEPA